MATCKHTPSYKTYTAYPPSLWHNSFRPSLSYKEQNLCDTLKDFSLKTTFTGLRGIKNFLSEPVKHFSGHHNTFFYANHMCEVSMRNK